MRLEFGRLAQADLDDLRDYSIEQFGIAHPDLRPGIRAVRCQQHRIYYTIDGDRVSIRRVLHTAMDERRHV